MRKEQTYKRMMDKDFRCDPVKTRELDKSYFTSLIIKLVPDEGNPFFAGVLHAYEQLRDLILSFDPTAKIEIYFDSAHITIKSLEDGSKQDTSALECYLPVVSPIVRKWVPIMGVETFFYANGLFTNLHVAKCLSVGIKFYPSLPLVQILRGEVGAAIYSNNYGLLLRPEDSFHTMLTHCTGFRARNLSFPMSSNLVGQFKKLVEKYDNTLFGAVINVEVGDIYLRNGHSDKLVTFAEVPV